MTFGKIFESMECCKKGTKYARTVRAFELDLSLDFRPPNSTSFIPTSCRENALMRLCSWAKKTVTFYFHISRGHCEGYQRQKAIHSDNSCLQGQRHPYASPKKVQSSSCSDLGSEVTVVVPRQTEVLMSVWGKPSLLSTNQRTFIYTAPQALSWRPSTIRSQVGPGSRLLVAIQISKRSPGLTDPGNIGLPNSERP